MKISKIKVVMLKTPSSLFSKNYSEDIENTVNNNITISDEDGTSYELLDFNIEKVENNFYLLLKYRRK